MKKLEFALDGTLEAFADSSIFTICPQTGAPFEPLLYVAILNGQEIYHGDLYECIDACNKVINK